MKYRGLICAWFLFLTIACAAEDDSLTLSYLKAHTDDWPKQVILKAPISFKLMVDGKEAGTMGLNEGTAVDLSAVTDQGLLLHSGSNTGQATPEQTDLWERVKKIRDTRELPARTDPAVSLKLPPNSESAEWYKKQLDNLIIPWLMKYPKSPLVGQMVALRDAFQQEGERVANGDGRRGDQWYTAAEFAAQRESIEVNDLVDRLANFTKTPDAIGVQAALVDVDKYSKKEAHPRLVRAAHEALEATLPTLTEETLRQQLLKQKDDMTKQKDKLIDELKETCKGFAVPGYQTKQKEDDVYYGDLLFRPKGQYYTGHHYGQDLLPYYPSDSGYYRALSDVELLALHKKIGQVEELKNKLAETDHNIEQAAERARLLYDKLTEMGTKFLPATAAMEEKILARLKEAQALDAEEAAPILADAQTAWPGNELAARISLEKLPNLVETINQRIAAGKIAEAARLLDSARKMISCVPETTLALVPIRKVVTPITPWLESAKALEISASDCDFETVLAANFENASEPFQKWLAQLKARVTAQRDNSSKLIDQAQDDLFHLRFIAAKDNFQKAKKLWPQNPDVISRTFYLKIAGGVGALIGFFVLLGLWGCVSTLFDNWRYHRNMKKKFKQMKTRV